MQILYSRIITNCVLIVLLSLGISSCSTSSSDDPMNEVLHGSISYPFYEPNPLGVNRPEEKFIIRSAVGNTEYTIEIPGAAKEYDVQIPLASLDSAATGGPDRPRDLSKPNATDRELVGSFPAIEKSDPAGTGFMDKAFGVSQSGGPKQSPSYTLGLAKVSKMYKRKEYEYALVEVNNMLSFYPSSPKLHKMKGTILVKLRNLKLAEKSWVRALEMSPRDRVLKRALGKLQNRIKVQYAKENGIDTNQPQYQIPEPAVPGAAPQNATQGTLKQAH